MKNRDSFFRPARLVFQERPTWDPSAMPTPNPALPQMAAGLTHLTPSPDGDFVQPDVLNYGAIEVQEQNDGAYFYVAQAGDTYATVHTNLTTIANADPDRFGYLLEYDYLDFPRGRSLNIPNSARFNAGELIPIPLCLDIRRIDQYEFVEHHALSALEMMRNAEFYGPYVDYIIGEVGEARLLAMMVAVAKAETDSPIGSASLHKYESRYNAFSLSCFHVLMEQNGEGQDGPGLRARKNLQMSEGQTYHPLNACRLFLAYLVEKAIERCDAGACADATFAPDEVQLNNIETFNQDTSFKFIRLEQVAGPHQTIENAVIELNGQLNLLRNPIPYSRRLVNYLGTLDLDETTLQLNDGVGLGQDDRGPYVVFFNSRTGKSSGRIRIDYGPAAVIGTIRESLPHETRWNQAEFIELYGADNSEGRYQRRLQTHYSEILNWREGRTDYPPLEEMDFYRVRLPATYPDYGQLNRPPSSRMDARDFLLHINGQSGNSFFLTNDPYFKMADNYLQPYLEHLSNIGLTPNHPIPTDQADLRRVGDELRLVYCRNRECQEFVVEKFMDRYVMCSYNVEGHEGNVETLLDSELSIPEDFYWDKNYYVDRLRAFLKHRPGAHQPIDGDRISYGLDEVGELFLIYFNEELGGIIINSQETIFVRPHQSTN